MGITIGVIVAAMLVVALCVTLIIGIVELVGAAHRIEALVERIEGTINKSSEEKPVEEGRETGPGSAKS
jgi:hypothetical protein